MTARVDSGVSLIEASHLGKRYATVQALADVEFSLRAGEVHALIGENGAGKSTLVKIVCGEIGDYAGSLVVRGARRHFDSPRQALAAGIAVIPQELQLVTSLSVAENILLGREPRGPGGLVDRDELHRLARQPLDAIETLAHQHDDLARLTRCRESAARRHRARAFVQCPVPDHG